MPTHRDTIGPTFEKYLRQYNAGLLSKALDSPELANQSKLVEPYVHPRSIAFIKAQHRQLYLFRCGTAWHRDIAARSTLEEFWLAPKLGKLVFMGMFAVPTLGSKSGWKVDDEEWHAFSILILKKDGQNGKHVVFWDCDPYKELVESTRVRDALQGYQRQAYDYLIKKSGSLTFWYNADRRWSGQGKCVRFSMERIRLWYEIGNKPYLGLQDPRLRGCFQLKP
ncbi:hypothetical protein HD806DRAFT_527661 [Xylariaceae sp. AK1471]|nr:hypothetical protein HD806DRAFT_527841 [Xylariaceae sp. AK1471]KAI3316743.1 hypothetical protein HD806DRAFT_527661 [Xylariaceae sp. AK1471]